MSSSSKDPLNPKSPRRTTLMDRIAADEFLKFEWSSHWEDLDVKSKQQNEEEVSDLFMTLLGGYESHMASCSEVKTAANDFRWRGRQNELRFYT